MNIFFGGKIRRCDDDSSDFVEAARFVFFSNMRWAGGILAFIFPWIHTWLVVKQPLWKIWKSVGMIIPNIWKKMFPNHQPDAICHLLSTFAFTCVRSWCYAGHRSSAVYSWLRRRRSKALCGSHVANIAPSLKLETQPIRRRWRSHGVENMMGVQWRLTTPGEKNRKKWISTYGILYLESVYPNIGI